MKINKFLLSTVMASVLAANSFAFFGLGESSDSKSDANKTQEVKAVSYEDFKKNRPTPDVVQFNLEIDGITKVNDISKKISVVYGVVCLATDAMYGGEKLDELRKVYDPKYEALVKDRESGKITDADFNASVTKLENEFKADPLIITYEKEAAAQLAKAKKELAKVALQAVIAEITAKINKQAIIANPQYSDFQGGMTAAKEIAKVSSLVQQVQYTVSGSALLTQKVVIDPANKGVDFVGRQMASIQTAIIDKPNTESKAVDKLGNTVSTNGNGGKQQKSSKQSASK